MLRPGCRVLRVMDEDVGNDGAAALKALRAAAAQLADATTLVARAAARAEAEERRKAREAPQNPDNVALRAWVTQGAGAFAVDTAPTATSDEPIRIATVDARSVEEPEDTAEVDEAAEAAAHAFVFHLVFEDGPVDCTCRVPRIFTADSRLGEGDGTVLAQQFGGDQGLANLCAALDGDGAVAVHMYKLLQKALAQNSDLPTIEE